MAGEAAPGEPLADLMVAGEELWRGQLAATADADFAGPCLLPGWNRAHLIGHLAGNAQALRNLISWATSGIERPMYPDAGARNRQIDEFAALTPGELRAACLRASEELVADWDKLPADRRSAQVRTFHGRPVPVSAVCWMRARETHIHAVDLDSGLSFADLSDRFLSPLLDDVTGGLSAKGAPAVTLRDDATGREWHIGETGAEHVTVTGDLAALAQWACGRGTPASLDASGAALPILPPWL